MEPFGEPIADLQQLLVYYKKFSSIWTKRFDRKMKFSGGAMIGYKIVSVDTIRIGIGDKWWNSCVGSFFGPLLLYSCRAHKISPGKFSNQINYKKLLQRHHGFHGRSIHCQDWVVAPCPFGMRLKEPWWLRQRRLCGVWHLSIWLQRFSRCLLRSCWIYIRNCHCWCWYPCSNCHLQLSARSLHGSLRRCWMRSDSLRGTYASRSEEHKHHDRQLREDSVGEEVVAN